MLQRINDKIVGIKYQKSILQKSNLQKLKRFSLKEPYMTEFVQTIKRTKSNILNSVKNVNSLLTANTEKTTISALQQILSTIATFDQNQIYSVSNVYNDEQILRNIKIIVEKIQQKNTVPKEPIAQKKQEVKQIPKIQQKKVEKSAPKPTKNESNSKGLFGMLGFLKKSQKEQPKQMILPQDTPAAKYDPIKKKWIFQGEQEQPQKQIPKPPPKLQGTKSAQSSISGSTKNKQKSELDQMTAPPSFKRKGTSTKQKKSAVTVVNNFQNKQQQKPISFVQEENSFLDSLMNSIDKEFYSLIQSFHSVQKLYKQQIQVQLNKRHEMNEKIKKVNHSQKQTIRKANPILQLTNQQCTKVFQMNKNIKQASQLSDQMLDFLKQSYSSASLLQNKAEQFKLMQKILTQIENTKIINKVFMNELKSSKLIKQKEDLIIHQHIKNKSKIEHISSQNHQNNEFIDLQKLRTQLQQLQDSLTAIKRQKNTVQAQLYQQKQNKKSVLKQNRQLKQKINDLQNNLKKEYQDLNKILVTSTQEIVIDNQNKKNLSSEQQNNRKNNFNVHKNLNQETQFLSMKLIQEQKKLSEVQKQKKQLQAKVLNLTKKIKELQNNKEQLSKNYNIIKQEYQDQKETHESLINQKEQLEKQLDINISKVEELTQNMQNQKNKIIELTKDKEFLQNALKNHSAVDQDTLNAHFQAMSNFAEQLSQESELLQTIQNKRAIINAHHFSDQSSSSNSSSKKSNSQHEFGESYTNNNSVFIELSEIISDMTKCYLQKMAQMKSQMMILQSKNQQSKQNNNKIKVQFHKQNQSLNRSISILQSMNQSYKKSKKENQQRISTLQIQNQTIKKKLLHLKQEEQFNKQMIEKTLKTSQVHDESITILKGDKQQLQLRIDSLQNQIYQKDETILEMQRKLQKSIEQLQKSEQALLQLQSSYKLLKQQLKQQSLNHQQIINKKQLYFKSIQMNQSQKIKSLTKNYNQLLQKHQKQLKNRQGYNEKYTVLQGQLKLMKKISKQKQETIEQLSKSVIKSQRDVESKQSEYQNTISRLQKSHKLTIQSNLLLQDEILQLSNSLEIMTKEKESLEQLAEQINKENQKLQQSSQKQIAELKNLLDFTQKSLQKLNLQLNHAKRFQTQHSNQFNQLNKKFVFLTQDHLNLQNSIGQTLKNFNQFQKDQNQIRLYLTQKIDYLNSQLNKSYQEGMILNQQIYDYTILVQTLDEKLNGFSILLNEQKEENQRQKASNQQLLELILNLQKKANEYEALNKEFLTLDTNYRSLYDLYDKNQRMVQYIQTWINQTKLYMNINQSQSSQEERNQNEEEKFIEQLNLIKNKINFLQPNSRQNNNQAEGLQEKLLKIQQQKKELQELINIMESQRKVQIEQKVQELHELQKSYDFMNEDFIRISNQNNQTKQQNHRLALQNQQMLQKEVKLTKLIKTIQNSQQQKIQQLTTFINGLKLQTQKLIQSQRLHKQQNKKLLQQISQLQNEKSQMQELILNMSLKQEEEQYQRKNRNSERQQYSNANIENQSNKNQQIKQLTQQLTLILEQNQKFKQKMEFFQQQKENLESLLAQKQLLITQLTQELQKNYNQENQQKQKQKTQKTQNTSAEFQENRVKLTGLDQIIGQLSLQLEQCEKTINQKQLIIKQNLKLIEEKDLQIQALTEILANIQKEKEGEEKIADLQSSQYHLKIKELQTQLSSSQIQREELILVIQEQETQINNLRQLNQTLKKVSIDSQQQNVLVYQSIIEKFKQKVQSQQEIIEKLEADLKNAQEELQNSKMYEQIILQQKHNNQKKQPQKQITKNIQIKQTKVEGIQHQQGSIRNELNKHIQKLNEQLSTKNDEILQMNQLVNSQQSQIQQLSERIKQNEKEIQQLKSKQKDNKKFHITSEQKQQILAENLSQLQKQKTQLLQKLKHLEKQSIFYQSKIEEHQKKQQEMKADILKLKNQLQLKDQDTMQMNELIRSQEAEVEQLAQKIKNYQTQIVLLSSNLQNEKQKFAELKEKLIQSQKQKKTEKQDKNQQNYNQQDEKIKALELELKETYEDLRNHKIQIDQLRINITEVNKLFSQRENKYEEKIISLEKQISGYANFKNKIKTMEDKYAEVEAENIEMSTQKVELLRMNNRLELENISLKRKLGISEVENIEVKTQNAPKTILRQTKSEIKASNESAQIPKPTGFFGSISSLFLTPIETDRMTKSTIKK